MRGREGRAALGALAAAAVLLLGAGAGEAFWLPPGLDGNVPSRVVAVGDSITLGVLGGDCAPPDCLAEEPYPAVLESLLTPAYAGYEVLNRGVGGETTAEGLGRLPSVLATDHPAFVLIMEGTNDATFGRSVDEVVGNLRAMVQTVKASQAIPLLGSIPPNFRPSSNPTADRARAIIADVNAQLPTVAAQEGVRFVDTFAALDDPGLFGPDDVLHPNRQGYRVLGAAWLGALADAVLDSLALLPRAYFLGVNAEAFQPGQLLRVDLTAIDGAPPAVADVYFGVMLPAAAGPALGCGRRDPVAFLTAAFTEVVLRCLSDPPEEFPTLYATPVDIATPLPLTRASGIWSLQWSPEFPDGDYTLFLVLTVPGDPTHILASALHRVTFSH